MKLENIIRKLKACSELLSQIEDFQDGKNVKLCQIIADTLLHCSKALEDMDVQANLLR